MDHRTDRAAQAVHPPNAAEHAVHSSKAARRDGRAIKGPGARHIPFNSVRYFCPAVYPSRPPWPLLGETIGHVSCVSLPSQQRTSKDWSTPVSTTPPAQLAHRHYALLRAVGAGRCELSCSCEPTLYIDGHSCCDQQAAHVLTHAGLIRHAAPGAIGQRVAALLTDAGRAVLSAVDRPLASAA
jgi:hypothetical protein